MSAASSRAWNTGRRWRTRPSRLILAAVAYTLMERLRTLALAGTELARASAATIRVKLIKIGAAILSNTRRVTTCSLPISPCVGPFLSPPAESHPPGGQANHAFRLAATHIYGYDELSSPENIRP